jgi:phosphopantothenoylcysteine decarboxylase
MVNILIGATGSVATIKLSELVNEVQGNIPDARIKVIVTEHARHFIDNEKADSVQILHDDDEWSAWKQRGDPVLHIEVSN